MPQRDLHEANRKSWNSATKQHNSHKGDQIAYFREGGNTLFPEEIALLGDVQGKTLVHLQCNAGQDTLSIAQHLQAQVTGVDISDEAISFAKTLAEKTDIPGKFVRSDIYDWFDINTTEYDVVFSSYGAIGWLSDINAWAEGVANALKVGGRFVLMEFHPFIGVFEHDWSFAYDYLGGKPLESDGVGDYVAESGAGLNLTGEAIENPSSFKNPHLAYEFPWGLADIITALLKAGLSLRTFHEYPYCNGWQPFENMRETDGRRMILPEDMPTLPMMFGLVAEKSRGTQMAKGVTKIEAIIRVLQDEFAPPPESAEAQQLCLERGESALPHLIDALRAEPHNPPHGITDTLIAFGSHAIGSLVELLHDDNWLLRFTGVNLLGRIGDSSVIEPLMQCLQDDNSRVTLSAIYWLGTLGDHRAIELLRTVTQNSDGKLREHALKALRRLE